MYIPIVSIAGRFAEFVHFYAKMYMFLWNMLFENKSPFEERSNLFHS
jgi:hypothetical protein